MTANNTHALPTIFTDHQSEETFMNLSDQITAILNGIENAQHPENIRVDIVAMRISRVKNA